MNLPVPVSATTRLPALRAPRPPSVAERLGYRHGWLVGNLPVVMQEDDLLTRFVTIFEEISTTVRHAVVSTDTAADLTIAPPRMVRYMGSWLGATGLDHGSDVAQQRAIVAATGATMAQRGTAHALADVLRAVTGGDVEVRDSGGVYRAGEAPRHPAAVEVRAEHAGHLRPSDLVALVRDEVPAHVQLTIWIGEEQAWPASKPVTPTATAP